MKKDIFKETIVNLRSKCLSSINIEDIENSDFVTKLYIDYNDIEYLPYLVLPSLREFSCNGNEIQSFNSSLLQASKLRLLSTIDNDINSFRFDDVYVELTGLVIKGLSYVKCVIIYSFIIIYTKFNIMLNKLYIQYIFFEIIFLEYLFRE